MPWCAARHRLILMSLLCSMEEMLFVCSYSQTYLTIFRAIVTSRRIVGYGHIPLIGPHSVRFR